MLIVTIDSGTTNTRIRVWKDRTVVSEVTESVGVRDTAVTGSNARLKQGIKQAFDLALQQANQTDHDDMLILASGMITSNVGLHEIPHLAAPVGINQLAEHVVQKILPDISSHPIWFIPGVKNGASTVALSNCEMMDVMRGEETETIGVLTQFNLTGPVLIVLPGSHSKYIKVNAQQEIESCATTLAGELLDVITKQTILGNSLNHQFAADIDEEYLLKGAESCAQVGLARTAFTVRILDLFCDSTPNQRANYLLGAVLYSDLLTIKQSQALSIEPNTTIVICGKPILVQALAVLFRHDAFFTGRIIAKNEDKLRPLSGLGAIAIAEKMQQLNNVKR